MKIPKGKALISFVIPAYNEAKIIDKSIDAVYEFLTKNRKMPFVSIILPCRDEEETIGTCVKKAKNFLKSNKIPGEVIVSDSSCDNSAKIAKQLGAVVVKHDLVGYGNAYLKGFEKAKGDYIIIADSDDTYNLSEASKFYAALNGGYDFIIGNRFMGKMEKGSMKPLHRYVGNPLLNTIFNIIFKTNFSDTHCGFRAFRKEFLKEFKTQSSGMEFALEMIVKAVEGSYKIKEVPVNYYRRKSPSHLCSFRDGSRHLAFMITEKLK